MKKLVLLLSVFSLTAISVNATEPLLLDFLTPQEISGIDAKSSVSSDGIDVTIPVSNTVNNINSNMIPQNNAAKGLPTVKKVRRGINIVTKQGRQTNTQWNPGGKGTKSYF